MSERQTAEAMEAEMHQEVFRTLIQIHRELDDMSDSIDVRLCYDAGGNYHVCTGDVSYDLHHGLACGDGNVYIDDAEFDLQNLARDLVEQVLGHLAMLED